MNTSDNFNFIIKGAKEIIFECDLKLLLDSKREIIVKAGFDPTSSDLHLGHLILFKKLRDFQLIGYKVTILIGDFTAIIGDPSGRNSVRKQLTDEEIVSNYKNYSLQLFKVLDEKMTNIVFNSKWLNNLIMKDFINILSTSTVARMLERSDFKSRYESNISIGMNEFLYPFFQAYDSVVIKADIELGGIDQKFNLLLGRELQKHFGIKPQVLIMMPIINGLDGKKKMSKTYNNHISLFETPYNIFCKIMSISDILMKDYFYAFGFYDFLSLEALFKNCSNPMDLKFDLAFKIISFLSGIDEAKSAKIKFIDRFCKKRVPDDIDFLYLYTNNL